MSAEHTVQQLILCDEIDKVFVSRTLPEIAVQQDIVWYGVVAKLVQMCWAKLLVR